MCIHIYLYIVNETSKFTENNMLNVINVEISQHLKLHILLHGVTLCFAYAIDDDNPQTLSEDHVTPCGSMCMFNYLCIYACAYLYIFSSLSIFYL